MCFLPASVRNRQAQTATPSLQNEHQSTNTTPDRRVRSPSKHGNMPTSLHARNTIVPGYAPTGASNPHVKARLTVLSAPSKNTTPRQTRPTQRFLTICISIRISAPIPKRGAPQVRVHTRNYIMSPGSRAPGFVFYVVCELVGVKACTRDVGTYIHVHLDRQAMSFGR